MDEIKALLAARCSEACGGEALIRPLGGSAKRRMDGTWEYERNMEIEVMTNAEEVFRILTENAKNIVRIKPPRAVYSGTGVRYVIEVRVRE